VEENKKAPMFKPTDTIVLELSVPKQQSKFCGIKTFNGPGICSNKYNFFLNLAFRQVGEKN
jgi:hypothetical protein